jgi:glycosyltransferase involved in cell wall biosynthesis
MNILGLIIISLFITIIVLAKDKVFGGKIDITGKLVKALATKRIKVLRTKLFVSVLISILVFLTLRTNLFDNFQIYKDLGFSSEEHVITTEKKVNSNDEAVHFFLGTLSGYAFDTWIAALAIGCMKEICDFADHYNHHSVNQAQIIHDGIMDPLFWALGGLVGCFSLETFHILLGKSRRKRSTSKLPRMTTDSVDVFHKNPQNPLISVVIPALNEERFIERTLLSLMNQDFKNYELIVVDNGSQDRTAQVAERFGARVVFEPTEGVGYSRQAGFMVTEAPIIATTDADTIVPPNWLSRILNEFDSDPELVAFGGFHSLYNGPFLARFAVRYLIFIPWIFDRIFSGGWTLSGANLAVRRKAFLQIGGFNTKLNLGEDADLSQRLRHVGGVKLDMGFRVETSGRRYGRGLFIAMIQYFPNGLSRIFFKKPEKFSKLPPIREEKFISDRYWLLWLAFSILILIIIPFEIESPKVEAKVKPIKERAVILEKAISIKGKDLIEKLKIKKRSRSSSGERKFFTYKT